MAWLGQTVSRLDSRRETAGYISGQTSAGRVCVTNAAGELGSSVVSLSELALLSGVSSTVQSQLDLLSASSVSIVGAATTVVSDNLTAGRVVVSTSTGKLGVSPTTAAQLAYVDATSSIQAQLNSKQSAGAYATTSELAAGLAGKQPSLGTGSVLTIGGLTIAAHATDRALVSSASGVATSVVTAAELGYLQGVTSGLQSQLTSLVLADGLLNSGKQDAGSYATTTELATKQPLIDNDHLAIARGRQRAVLRSGIQVDGARTQHRSEHEAGRWRLRYQLVADDRTCGKAGGGRLRHDDYPYVRTRNQAACGGLRDESRFGVVSTTYRDRPSRRRERLWTGNDTCVQSNYNRVDCWSEHQASHWRLRDDYRNGANGRWPHTVTPYIPRRHAITCRGPRAARRHHHWRIPMPRRE